MSNPTVSIVIPYYNAAKTIGRALESVRKQTSQPHEVIVVDDGSKPEEAKVLEQHGDIHLITQTNQGAAVARNAGVVAARGEYLAFLDSDDAWVTHKLETQVRVLENNPELGFTVCRLQNILEGERPAWIPEDRFTRTLVGFIPSALLVRKTVFTDVGIFDPATAPSEDADWFIRAERRHVRYEINEEVLLHRYVHQNNLSADATKMQRGLLKALHKSLRQQ